MKRLRAADQVFIWCIVIIASNGFGLYNIASDYTQIYYTTAIAFLLCIVSIFVICVNSKQVRLKVPKKRKVDRYAALFLFWIIVELLISYIKYSETQNLVSTLKDSLFFFAVILLYYAFDSIIKQQADIEFMINAFIRVSVICSVLAIIALIVYTRTGNNILGLNVENYSFIRNNRGHFMIGSMVVIPATVFLWCRIITGKYNLWSIIILLLNLIHIVYVGQTRMVIFTTLIILVLSYLVVSKRSKKVKILLLFLLAVILVVGEIQSLREEFSKLSIDNSVVYRLDAIEFYLKQIFDHPIFGMGFISTSNRSLSSLLYGPLNRFFRTDVGMIGFVDCLGILSGVWYVSFLIYSIRLMVKLRSSIDIKLYEYCFSISLLMILGSINLFPIDEFRTIYFPVYMILIRVLERLERYDKKTIPNNMKSYAA